MSEIATNDVKYCESTKISFMMILLKCKILDTNKKKSSHDDCSINKNYEQIKYAQ